MENTRTSKTLRKEERQATIELWQESGKSKTSFCKEFGINYQTFIGWTSTGKKKHTTEKSKSSFIPIELRSERSTLFAELQFEHGMKIYLHREVTASFLRSLIG